MYSFVVIYSLVNMKGVASASCTNYALHKSVSLQIKCFREHWFYYE